MGYIFGSLYCWFEDFFGLPLAEYLWGNSSPDQQTNMFLSVGLSMVVISLFVMSLFYYIINHPKLNNWHSWLLFLVCNAVVNLLVGWRWVFSDMTAGKMFAIDAATGQKTPLPIGETEIFSFGITNMTLSVLFFILFSYFFKWWSTNCSKAPF